MRFTIKILLICLVIGGPLLGQVASAEDRPIVMAQSGKSLNQAVEQVRRQYPDGRIISAETKNSGGREVHHIRVMVDGKVKTVKVNGRSTG
jgi:hypothetical protein